MQVGLNNWHAFKDHFLQAYRHYQIRKKSTAAAHAYEASENHEHETDAQVMTVDALQALSNSAIEYKDSMVKLTSTNLTISQILTQSQEKILVIPKQLQTLQAQMNSKKPSTEKPATYNKQYLNK